MSPDDEATATALRIRDLICSQAYGTVEVLCLSACGYGCVAAYVTFDRAARRRVTLALPKPHSFGDRMHGRLIAIWSKRAHRGVMDPLDQADLEPGKGLVGDVNRSRFRQVTLIDEAAWEALCQECGVEIPPIARRANLLLRGLELQRSRGKRVAIGEARIELLGETTPCERMEELHPGLGVAMGKEWRGGAFGRVVQPGTIRVGDAAGFVEPNG